MPIHPSIEIVPGHDGDVLSSREIAAFLADWLRPLVPDEPEPDEPDFEAEPDLADCPYYRSEEGGTCSHGCTDEPQCVTCRPDGGWPSERPTDPPPAPPAPPPELAVLISEDDTAFEVLGGLDYSDALALGLYEGIISRGTPSGGVMVSQIDLLWLLEGYARLRSRP